MLPEAGGSHAGRNPPDMVEAARACVNLTSVVRCASRLMALNLNIDEKPGTV